MQICCLGWSMAFSIYFYMHILLNLLKACCFTRGKIVVRKEERDKKKEEKAILVLDPVK